MCIFGIDDLAIAGGIGALGSAAIGASAQSSTNAMNQQMQREAQAFNLEEANKARAFDWTMATTGYQRARSDLEKAGFNPILAVTNGQSPGIASPSASSPPPPTMESPLAHGLGSAQEAGRLAKEIAQTDSQVKLNKAAKAQKDADANLSRNSAAVVAAGLPAAKEQGKVDLKKAQINRKMVKVDAVIDRLGPLAGSVRDLVEGIRKPNYTRNTTINLPKR